MNSNKLYAVTALFDTPDQIIHAAEKVSGSGYTEFDVNTPYPVHGMDRAMKLKPSKLGFVTLFFGLSGAAFALLFMFWALSIDYPMIIGGKPFFAMPAFIPITFEVTVLLATLSTVIGMLTFFFKYPENNHPLHDTEYMKNVSLDKFGICILASDKSFEESKVKELLRSTGGKNIQAVYFPEKEVYAMFQPKFILFLIGTALVVSAATYITLNKLLYMEPFHWMMEQARTDAQEKSDYYGDGFGMRQPVKGTVARGFMPYPLMDKPVPLPEETLTNPLIPTGEVLATGQRKFLTFCSPCHGNYADGDSRLRGQFPNPPTLHSQRAREMTDGMIYHIMTVGQNTMPSYASQVTREERWAIVNYVRVLQRAKNAKDTDLQAVKQEGNKNVQ
jgi:mono/diheme cytochrome c family protein